MREHGFEEPSDEKGDHRKNANQTHCKGHFFRDDYDDVFVHVQLSVSGIGEKSGSEHDGARNKYSEHRGQENENAKFDRYCEQHSKVKRQNHQLGNRQSFLGTFGHRLSIRMKVLLHFVLSQHKKTACNFSQAVPVSILQQWLIRLQLEFPLPVQLA